MYSNQEGELKAAFDSFAAVEIVFGVLALAENDAVLATILEGLGARGLRENTMLIVTGAMGGHFDSTRTCGPTLWVESMRSW